jgi:hypothetical protein
MIHIMFQSIRKAITVRETLQNNGETGFCLHIELMHTQAKRVCWSAFWKGFKAYVFNRSTPSVQLGDTVRGVMMSGKGIHRHRNQWQRKSVIGANTKSVRYEAQSSQVSSSR